MSVSLADRFHSLPAPLLEDSLQLETGRLRDYEALAEHHYRAQRPATVTRVLVLRHTGATAASRFAGLPPPAEPVGVLLESLPALCCRLRDEAVGPRYSRLRDMRARSRVLSEEVRCISRVVVHPRWRGLGLAVRLVHAALDSAQTLYTESLAAMGRVNPFFEKAGMTAYHRPPHEHDARLAASLHRLGLSPVRLALLDSAWARVEALPAAEREWLFLELPALAREDTPQQQKRARMTELDVLRAARRRLLCEPVYYLKRNEERGKPRR